MKKFIVMVSLLFSVLGSIVSYADEWKQDSNGWQYVYSDGTVLRDNWYNDPETGKNYHFDSNGYMQTGIVNIEGKDRYFKDSGELLVNGLIPDGRMADRNGEIFSDVNDGVTFMVAWLPDVKVGNSKIVSVGIKNIGNKSVTVKNRCDITTNEKTTMLSLYNPDTHGFYDERTINPNETVNMSFINPNLNEFYTDESSEIMFPVQIDGIQLFCYVNEHVSVIMHKSQEELNKAK